jgi:hypothetical protein
MSLLGEPASGPRDGSVQSAYHGYIVSAGIVTINSYGIL